eukprot:UN03481
MAWSDRVKRAEMKAMEKMREMKHTQPKTKKPGFFNFGGSASNSGNMDIGALLKQMNRGDVKGEEWKGPNIKGFDYESLSEFVDEMMEFQQNEFDKKLENETKETGLIAGAKQKLRHNAERALFNFTHKTRGIMARGMLRKMKQDEDKHNK